MPERPSTRLFIISRTTATDRRREFTARAEHASVPWSFFEAHTAADPFLHYNPKEAAAIGGRALTKSELGCYSSHYALWRQLLGDATADRYIVFEDDVIVDWSFIEKLHYVHDSEIGADFLRLFFMSVAPTRTLKAQLFGTYYIVELFGYAFGSQAYIITKAAAERFVLNLQRVVRPIDLAMESAWSHGVPNLAVFPFPVIHVSGESSMEPQRWVSEPKPFGLKFRRAVERSRDAVRKAVWRCRRALFRLKG